MSPEEKGTLSKLRLDMAQEALDDAKSDLEENRLRSSTNRAYYAVFYAMRAVLALDGIDRKKHSGVSSEFQRLYVKTGIFDGSISPIIRRLFNMRAHNDYDDVQIILLDNATQQLHDAETVVNAIKTYLQSRNT